MENLRQWCVSGICALGPSSDLADICGACLSDDPLTPKPVNVFALRISLLRETLERMDSLEVKYGVPTTQVPEVQSPLHTKHVGQVAPTGREAHHEQHTT